MNRKGFLILAILFLLLQLKISKSLTSSSANYSACIGQQGAVLTSSNYNLLLALGSPSGDSSSSESIFKLSLGFISECIESICCDFDSVCEEKETQDHCPDCKTVVEVIPFRSPYKSLINISINFSDSRYSHKIGSKIKIKLSIDKIPWTNAECFSDAIIVLYSSQNFQTCDWSYGKSQIRCGNFEGNMKLTYFPEENKININGICKSESIPPGRHKIAANISLYRLWGD